MRRRVLALLALLLPLVFSTVARADAPPRGATIVDARAAMLSGDHPLARAILEATAAALAIALDDVVIARDTRPATDASARLAPSISSRREGGFELGLTGTF